MGPSGTDEGYREAVCNAFAELLASTPGTCIMKIAERHGLGRVGADGRHWGIEEGLTGPHAEYSRSLAIERIAKRVRKGESIMRMCHCHPKQCHAKTIAAAIRGRAALGEEGTAGGSARQPAKQTREGRSKRNRPKAT